VCQSQKLRKAGHPNVYGNRSLHARPCVRDVTHDLPRSVRRALGAIDTTAAAPLPQVPMPQVPACSRPDAWSRAHSRAGQIAFPRESLEQVASGASRCCSGA